MINVMTTFWRFLNEHTIEIPIIQRDYAQGRLGKEELRKTFLKDLKQALDSCKPLKLDFVYGAVGSGKLNPLDGQQRLTTLWLLHWYLAYMAGAMNKDVKRVLAKFTYETRISSREFCRCLADFDKLPPPGADVVGHIQNQTWFRSAWNDDPTIQSMLRMLGGTAHNDNDGIEGVFHSCYDGECIECRLDQRPYSNAITYGEYWQRLIGADCPIIFYSLDIHGVNQTDDLYIKMNARGKPLTSFENFKADLAGYISRQAAGTSNAGKSCDGLNAPETGLAIKMDTDWMNGIFWKNKSSDSAVDEIYFAFINRFFFNAYALTMTETGDIKVGDDKVFDFLYGRNASKESADARIAYLGFDSVYRKVIEKDVGILDRLAMTLDSFKGFLTKNTSQSSDLFRPPWDSDDFHFVPQYKIGEKGQVVQILDFAGNKIREIGSLTQPNRVVFHAVCEFFEHGWNAKDENKELLALKDWMRVVWNIVENANINNIPSMIGCLRLVEELAEHSHNILEWLKDKGATLKSEFAKDQIAEEIEKSKQILSDRTMAWKKKIEDAEKAAFFRGAIRFLFKDGKGDVNWKDFDTKYSNTKKYFDKDGIREGFKVSLTKSLVLQCSSWEKQLYDHQIFNPDKSTWRWILCARIWEAPIHNLLVCENLGDLVASETLGDENANKYIKPILESLPYSTIIASEPKGRFRRYGTLAFYRPNAHYAMFTLDWGDFKRNSLLQRLTKNKDFELHVQHIIEGSDQFYKGWDIRFKYKNHCFLWGTDNNICLLDEGWNPLKQESGDDSGILKSSTMEENLRLATNTNKIDDPEAIITELEKLINLIERK